MSNRNRRRRGRAPFSRLVLSHGLVATVTLVVVALTTLTLTRNYLSASLNRELDAHVVAFEDGPAAAVGTPADLAQVTGEWLATRSVPDGQVIVLRTVSEEVLATSGGLDLTEVLGDQRLLEAETSRRLRVETQHGAIRVVSVPLLLEGRPVGTLIAAASEAEVAAILGDLARRMAWAALAGLLFAGLVGTLAASQVSRPLTTTTHAVEPMDVAGEPATVGAAGVWKRALERRERWVNWQSLVKQATIVAELATIFAVVFALKFGVGSLLVKRFRVWSDSMVPTLAIGQQILVDRVTPHFDRPDRGDIVVFNPPVGATSNTCGVRRADDQACPLPTARRSDNLFIKRVVGLPGDRLKVLQGMVYVDGKLQSEPDVRADARCDICNLPIEITVPPGHFFVMGDNRAHSDDSRYWGPVPGDSLIGRAFFSYWPLNRLGPP